MRSLLPLLALAALAASDAPLPAPLVRDITPLPRPPTTLRVLTWNVLADRSRADERLPGLFAAMAAADADLIALQEAAPWFLERLAAQPWAQPYQRTSVGGAVQAPGGVCVLSRLPLAPARVLVLPSRLDRVAVRHEIAIGGERLAIVAVHLDSMPADRGIRVRQLAACFSALAGAAHAAVVGDCNFGDGDAEETAALDPAYADAWRTLRGEAPGFTWDIARNPLARANSFPDEPSRRLDRVLIRSPRWRVVDVALVGEQPLRGSEPPVFASDHFGLVVTMRAGEP